MQNYFDWWVYIVLAIPGIILFIVNWVIYFHNRSGKRYVSGIFLVGGLWIAVVCLISPLKWLAFIGLADPGIWLLLAAIVSSFISQEPVKNNSKKNSKSGKR